MNLNILTKDIPESKFKLNLIQLQIRVKSIIESLLSSIESKQALIPLFRFLKHITTAGKFMPKNLLTQDESELLSLNTYGRIM